MGEMEIQSDTRKRRRYLLRRLADDDAWFSVKARQVWANRSPKEREKRKPENVRTANVWRIAAMPHSEYLNAKQRARGEVLGSEKRLAKPTRSENIPE